MARSAKGHDCRDQPRLDQGHVQGTWLPSRAVTAGDSDRKERRSLPPCTHACCSPICAYPLGGLAGGAATTTRGTDPLLPRVGTKVQRHRGVGSPPTGSAEAGGGRGGTPRTSRTLDGELQSDHPAANSCGVPVRRRKASCGQHPSSLLPSRLYFVLNTLLRMLR